MTPPARRDFRVALVGCGRIAQNHFDSVKQIDGLSFTAVCDIIESRAKNAGELLGVPWFTDYERMLREAECDVVVIATPSGLHPQHGILAAQAGKHVISEKPMAITLASADALVHACDDAKVQLFVVKQNRLNPPIQLLRKAIEKGRSAGFTSPIRRCGGRVRRSITIRQNGAARGNSMAVPL